MKWKWAAHRFASHKFASGRFAGTHSSAPNTQVATAKTAPLVTLGFGFHPRYFLLNGWTVPPTFKVARARKSNNLIGNGIV